MAIYHSPDFLALTELYRQSRESGSNREQDFHILNVNEQDFPDKYRDIVRRIQQANSDTDIRHQMSVEDIYIDDYKQTERQIEKMKDTINEKDKVLEEQRKLIKEQKIIIEKMKSKK